MFLVDAHQDLAFNALRFGRDLRRPLAEIRRLEGAGRRSGGRDREPAQGQATVSLPELQRGRVGLVFASLFALPARMNRTLPGNTRQTYQDVAGAAAVCREQLDYYHRLADELDQVRLITDRPALEALLAAQAQLPPAAPPAGNGAGPPVPAPAGRQNGASPQPETDNPPPPAGPIGLVPLMEGADAIQTPEALEEWFGRGLRLIGPAWDDTLYAAGAWRGGGGFTPAGHHLMEVMADLGLILDITHLSEKASLEALERYAGPVVATHCNARALVPGPRQLSDDQLRRLAERDGVTGIVLYNRFLKAGYRPGDGPQAVTLDHVTAHIDHVCQVLGSSAYVGLGSDLDGGFGAADIPAELDSVADLGRIARALAARGYATVDIEGIMGGNWVRILRTAWA